MKHFSILVGVCLSVALLAACGNPPQGTSSMNPLTFTSSMNSRDSGAVQKVQSTNPTLYVLDLDNGEAFVNVYGSGGARFLRRIDVGPYTSGGPVAFAVGRGGLLYAAAYDGPGFAHLQIYSNRGKRLVRKIQQRLRKPFSYLTVDASSNLYSTCGKIVCEYANSKTPAARELPQTFGPIAVDASGNAAVDDCRLFGSELCVFAPAEKEPYWQITSGLDGTQQSLTFDESGTLYVAMVGYPNHPPGSVAVYAPGSSAPTRTITNGIHSPNALLVDGSGNLYVYGSFVTVYAPGGSAPIRTITDGVEGDIYGRMLGAGSGLAIDGSGMLYVANSPAGSPSGPGNVTVYRPGKDTPIRTVTQGLNNPIAVAIGP